MKILKKIKYLPVLVFLILLLQLSVSNVNIPIGLGAEVNAKTMGEFTRSLEGSLQEELRQRYFYINLNGLMARTLGIHDLNNVIRLNNDYLIRDRSAKVNTEEIAEKEAELSTYLNSKGICYLSVPVPNKYRFYDLPLAPGYEDGGVQTAVEIIDNLNQLHVTNVDMNRWFQENGWSIEDVFFRTDHHWKPEAAFVAGEQICKKLSEMDSSFLYKEEFFSEENWNCEVYEDWFLGSEGKRTGSKYAGVDDLSYIYPKFETDITVNALREDRTLDTTKLKSVYATGYLEKADYFGKNANGLYLGKSYPLVYIRNAKAANNKKLVVVGDSYRLPVEVFLSTQFAEMYHVDTRHYRDGSFMELVTAIEPDYVLSLFSEGQMNDNIRDYQLQNWMDHFENKDKTEIVWEKELLSLTKTSVDGDYKIFYGNLTPGSYEINVEEIELTHDYEVRKNNPEDIVMAAIINTRDGKVLKARYFMAGYPEAQKWYFTIPKDEKANYAVVFYNGMNTITMGNSVQIGDITLYQYS